MLDALCRNTGCPASRKPVPALVQDHRLPVPAAPILRTLLVYTLSKTLRQRVDHRSVAVCPPQNWLDDLVCRHAATPARSSRQKPHNPSGDPTSSSPHPAQTSGTTPDTSARLRPIAAHTRTARSRSTVRLLYPPPVPANASDRRSRVVSTLLRPTRTIPICRHTVANGTSLANTAARNGPTGSRLVASGSVFFAAS